MESVKSAEKDTWKGKKLCNGCYKQKLNSDKTTHTKSINNTHVLRLHDKRR